MKYAFHERIEIGTNLIIKVTAHQWNWNYEYSDLIKKFNSFHLPREEAEIGQNIVLSCDKACVVPFSVPTQFLITREDVLHSWAVPSLGVKCDAIPGTISTINTNFTFPGIFFGICRELCGAFHAFMPINVEATSPFLFCRWLKI